MIFLERAMALPCNGLLCKPLKELESRSQGPDVTEKYFRT